MKPISLFELLPHPPYSLSWLWPAPRRSGRGPETHCFLFAARNKSCKRASRNGLASRRGHDRGLSWIQGMTIYPGVEGTYCNYSANMESSPLERARRLHTKPPGTVGLPPRCMRTDVTVHCMWCNNTILRGTNKHNTTTGAMCTAPCTSDFSTQSSLLRSFRAWVSPGSLSCGEPHPSNIRT